MQFDGASLGSNQATVIGFTPGGDFSPQPFDLTTLQPGDSVPFDFASLYDYLPVTGSLSLSGDSFLFTPTRTGWTVAALGSPEPSTLIFMAGAFLLFAYTLCRPKRIIN
jgi:hypothetical protein